MEKQFTIEEANKSLSLVRPIVSDILEKMREAKRLHAEVKNEKTQPKINEVEMLHKLRQVEKLLNDVEYHMKELESVGAVLKDLERGIIDFPAMFEGRPILLCWAYGEKTVATWHEREAGFEGRKSIDLLLGMAEMKR